ncbi:cellulose binding domain-containing protein [Streptomyces sp. NPDC060194]|uniref:cellulose binding domain-containing protein n=1 Tax=Streptomyces sp. NPDC060194 TaxID=3347069 RepID=UPI0036658C0C
MVRLLVLVGALAAGGVFYGYPKWKEANAAPPELTLRYRTDTAPSADAALPWLEVINTSSKPVPLDEVTLRYHFSADGDVPYAFNCVHAAVDCSNVSGRIVAAEKPTAKADHYLELAFTKEAGSLAAGANSKGIEIQLYRVDHKKTQQGNDHSYDRTKTTFKESDLVTAYRAGKLVWGTEPGAAEGAAAAAAAPRKAPVAPKGVMFDNFHYRGPKDPSLFKHGWLVRTSEGGPGIEDTWSADNVSFPADKDALGGQVLNLRASTDGTTAGTTQSSLGSANKEFRSGTYAARVHFTDRPAKGEGGDHVNQTFYTIGGKGAEYSELDYEYMPNGGWGAPGPKLDTTSWHDADGNDRITMKHMRSLEGWHTLTITVDGDEVTYRIDGKKLYSHDDPDYAPRAGMSVNFNTWFVDLPFTGDRHWDMKVDWMYYNADDVLDVEQVEAAVEGFTESGLNYFDTVPKS